MQLTPNPEQQAILERAGSFAPDAHITAEVCGDKLFMTAHCKSDREMHQILAAWATNEVNNHGIVMEPSHLRVNIVFPLTATRA